MGISTPFPAVGADGPDDALRPDRVIVSAFLTWRLTGLATGAAALVAGWGRHRRPLLAAAQLTAAIGESGWLAWRLRNAERWSDRGAGAADLVAGIGVLGASRFTVAVEDRALWLNWAPWSFAANVVAGQAMGVDPPAVGLAGAATVTALHAASGRSVSDMLAGGAGMGMFYIVGRIFARQIRNGAARLEDAQRAAVAAGARLAAERERLAQLRLLHDQALQTLEAIGGGRFSELADLRAAAAAEGDRLRRTLDAHHGDGRRLDSELEQIAAEHRAAGLTVELELGALHEVPAPVVAALAGAVSEALTNVRKHAAVKVAAVRAQPVRAGNGIVVTVEDQGQGFITATRRGFGTTESIIRRLNDAGGAATIDSTPGEGTLVTLEWPR